MPHGPPRRWFRYSLRTLLIAMSVAAIWLGWTVSLVHQRREARVAFEHEGWPVILEAVNDLPWLRRALGDEPVQSIFYAAPPNHDLTAARAVLPEAVMYAGGDCLHKVEKSQESDYLQVVPELSLSHGN